MSENFKKIIRELPPVFNTEEGHHIGKEFNSPCIIGSSLYQRQTGALTSNFLKVFSAYQKYLIRKRFFYICSNHKLLFD